MIPTSPTNARQPCSGFGRWTCMPLAPDPQSRFAYGFDRVLQRRIAIARRGRGRDRLANVVFRGGTLGVVADNFRVERDARVFGDLPRANSSHKRQAMEHPGLADLTAETRDLGRADRAPRPRYRREPRPNLLFGHNHFADLIDESINDAQVRQLAPAEVRRDLALPRAVPATLYPRTVRRCPDLADGWQAPALFRAVEYPADVVETPLDARVQPLPLDRLPDGIAKLERHGPFGVGHLPAPMESLDHLLRAERNQYADDDDAHLANERAP